MPTKCLVDIKKILALNIKEVDFAPGCLHKFGLNHYEVNGLPGH